MKILYLPFKIIAGIVGAKVGKNVFQQIWGSIDDDDPPPPKNMRANYSKVIGAAALKAATLAAVVAVVDRTTARAFRSVTGYDPAEQQAKDLEKKKEKEREKEEEKDQDD